MKTDVFRLSGALPKTASGQSQVDTITLTDALELLREHGSIIHGFIT
jgi:hypothetical protein